MYPIVIALRRIDHVCLRVADLDEASRRYTIQFGLTERERHGGRAFLRCGYEPYSLELVEEGEPGFDHHAFELARTCSLGDAAAQLDRHGVHYEQRDGALHLADPDGFGVELVPYRPDADSRPDVARSTTELHAFPPRKLGPPHFLTGNL